MLQKYNIEMATLKEVYDAFKADGAPLPDTYEDFEKYMTSGPDNGYEHRKQWYDAFKADGAPLPDTYEDFSRALFKVEADEKPAQTARATQPSQSAEPAPKPATRYFKLRRGGEDFTVTTDEVNAAGGLGAWAKAHPGAPVRVYMQGKNEDGTDFNGHVDLSVAHDRNKRLGYKYSTYSHPIVNKPQKSWTPTTQQKIAMSHQLHKMQTQANDMLDQSRERTKNVSEYYRDNRDSGFHAVEGKPTYNSRTGKVEKTYLTPTGDRTTDKNLAELEAQEARAQYEFNNRMKAAGLDFTNDIDVNRQMIADRLKENEARLKELYAEREVERYGERAGDTGWDKFVRTFGGAVNRGVTANAPTPEQNLTERDKEIKDLLAENDMLSEAKRTLDAGRDLKQSGGLMGGFFDVKNNAKNITRGLTDVAESADTYLSGVMSLHNAERLDIIKDKVDKGVELTDSELNLVYAAMLNQDASSSVKLPHGYTAGKVTGEMLPFMIQMALNPASGLGRALTKKFGTTALKRIAASVAGDVAEAAVLSNSLQAPRTIADIRNRHRGEITEHDGKIGFVGGESLPMAIYKGEASSIIENYTELLGSHFGAIGKGIWRGVDKGARKLGAGKVMDNVSRMVNNIKASDWAKGIANIESRAQWNGTIGEVMEEEAGIVLNSIFTGDNKLSDLVDAEQQIDIVLGVGLFGGFVSGIKTAGYPIARAHANSNLRKKDSEGAQQFSSDKWAAIKEQIDTPEDEALAQTVLSMVKVNGHSQEQQRAIIEYAAALTKARGYNLADASRKQEPQTEADSAQDEVDTAFNEGYEAATPQQMADAQNMFEYQRKRAEDILADQQLLDILDSNPVGALMGMTQTGMYTQEEIDAARDYANAKTVRDGILQRVTDDIDERIAQSDAMINGRVNRETGSILSATMDLDDRQVYIVGGEVVMNPDGTIDYDASDESLVVCDAVTGELEFTAPKSIVKVGEAIDPEAEKANAADNIRQQAAQAAANALNGTLAFNPGDVVRINDGGGLTDVTIVGPVVDEESGMPVESQLTVQFPNGQQTAFTKEQLQAFADAANLERLNQYEQERAAQRAQQRGAAEVEATRPAFALNDEFTILNDDGTPIHGSITGELDEDGMVEIYTEEPINGNKVNRFMPGELEGMFDTYNGAAIATAAPEGSEGGESSAEAAVQNHSSEAEAEQPETALGRIPLGENGKPDFGAVDAETAWDGLVEKYEGNKGRAQGFAANMVKIKEAALKKAEKVKSKPTEDPDEWDAAEQERENAIEQARRELEHWQSVAGVDEKRQAAVRAQQEAERAEAERAEREAAEAEKKRKAALDKRLHDTYEDVKDVPEAVEVLEDMDPRDIYEAAAQLLSGQKVLWGDAGVKVGARSETGFGEEERRRLFGLFASEANGGKSLSRLAEDAMKQQCETYGIPYDNQDARNALIDVISGARTVGDIRNYIANNRIDEARRLAEAKRRHEEEQYDEFCRQEYHLSAEEVEAYEDQLLAELSERDREFDANEYNDYIADEMARAAEITEQQKNGTEDNDTRRGSTPGDRRVQENDTEGKGTVPGRGYEVLPESRADQSSGAAADGDRSGIQPADGVQSDGPASAVAQGAQRGGIADVGRRKADDSPYGGLAEEVTSAIGPFGKIYTQFRGKPREAVTFLLAKRDGEAIGALHHKDVGEIDLVWGEEGSAHSDGFGLAKLAKYHPEVLFNLQEILNDMAVAKRSANRVQLESEKYKAAVRLTWDNQKKTWLLTMFEKKNSVLDNTTDTDKTHMGNGNDTATPENTVVSDRKDNDSASDKQASGEESLPQLSDDKRKPGLQAAVEAASAEVNTEPTEAQKKAGNYKKGHVTIGSFDITIENPAGSVRRGVDADGKEWSTTMANAYGEIRGTQSVDGDPIDVFLATDMDAWNGRKVFVVDQTNTDGSFDEHKVMLGFNSSEEAIKAYLANYDDSWAKTHPGLRISEVSLDDFKKWVASSHRKGKAFADYASVSKVAKVADIADRGSDAAKAAGPEQKDDASDSAAVSNQGDPQFVNAPSSDLLAKLTDEEREAIEDYFEEYQSVEIRCLTSEEEIDSSELSAEARDELHRLYDDGENLAAYCRENKKIYIFAGRVAADSLMYTLVHENTHAAIDAVRAEAETVLPKIVEQIADVALNKKRTFGDLYDAIKGEYPSEEAAEELLAYAIQRGEMRPEVRAALLDALDPQTRKFVENRILKRIYGKEKLQTVYGVRQLSSEDYGNDERGRYAGHSRSSEEAGGERFEAGEGKKSASDKPITPSGNRLVSEERYQELKKRMIQKFGGQFNMGVDPEILAIGTEMAVYHIEKGARKFAAYAKAMIADLGDFIRPYLKSFYNAVRDMPEAEAAGLVADMDSYEDVRRVDIANFDKTGVDAMATAAAVVAEQEAEDDVLCRPVTDKATLDRLNSEPTIKVYRAMQMIDGGLRPPMSGKVDGEWREATEVGIWEEAEEHPEMADEKGRFKLDKGNGKSIKAAYNPYIHTSRTPINDQFSSAWSRPELVIVEVEVPLSELTSGYRAEKAKDTVGEKEWKSGPVGRALAKIGQARRVILSRWSRIVRVVPVEEVAEAYAQRLNAHGIEVPFNTVPPALRDALAERGVKIGKPEKGNAGSASLPAFQQWINEQERQRMGDGYGAYTDEEVSYLNDPVSKVMGKNRFSKKRQAEFAARERQRMVARIQELSERMHLDNVEILTDASQLEGKRATAKGFYNKRTGKITIVIPNNVSTIDAEQTLLHEAVAHYGLRQLFGKQFDTFLDNVYQSADESIRKKIAEMAAQNGWDFRTATEEYLAGLAEDTNFEDARGYASGWWQRVKRLFIDMLERIGFEGFRDKVGVVLTDNELRYILWRSYENLAEPGRYRSILGEAKDVAMQSDLKVGNYAERGIEAEYAAEPSAITELSKRFDEALKQYEERRLPQGFRFELGMPSAYLKSAGFPNLPICMRATLLARKAGDERHPFEASDLKGLVEAIQQPIAIFEYSKPNMRNLIVDVKRGDKHFLVGVTLDYKAGDIEINSVSGLFPKESHEWIKWIQDGKAIRIDQKEKVQTIIDSLRTNPAESERIGLNLDDVTKIVKSFENPTVEEEELFRPGDFSPRDKALARHEYERIVSSGSYQFQEAVQDSMLGLKKLYQAILGPGKRIEDVVGFENAYLFENRMSSMNAGEQHEYFIRYMQPLLKEIGKICGADKRKRKELTDYLMAKHGLERNEYMRNEAAKNGEKTDRDFAGLIGLTGEADWQNAEDTARQWVDDYESMVDTAALWEAINKATKATLEKVYLSGIISKKTYEKILGMYDYYVPLRGWNETTSEQVYGYLTSKDGPLGGSIMKKAEGRESMADDPIATIGMMADDAIRQGNRNLMKQRFLNFILNHPSDAVSVHDIWLQHNDATGEWEPVFADVEDTDTADEVAQKVEAFEQRMEALRAAEPTKYKRGREAQHIPYKVVKGNLREHQVLIKRNGRTFVATINGNPRAAQALNGLTNPDVDQNGVVGNMLKAGTWINRQLSAFYTTRNPDFVVSNFFRDALYSNCMTWVKESPRYALRFHKNFGRLNPVVMRRLLGKWENGTLDMSDKYEKMFYQFMKNGGETGYTNVRDIEGHKRAVAAELKKQGSTGRKAWAALGMQLDLLNRSAENCARFAAFVTSREFGRSIDRAIYDAKEISVNFNKKGSGGKMVNANGQTALGKIGAYLGGGGRLLYVFWNAGIQGMTNFARQAKLHPVKATAGASALMALGYAIPMLAEMLGGGDGDDDDKNAYYNLPEYIRRSNICFYAGEQWVTIPLPIEYRAMYGMGELAYGVISGNERYSGMELGLQMAGQVTQLLPNDMLEGGGGISPFIPSAAKPFTEAYIMNKSWTGLPVYKDTAFNKDDPEWTKAYASADKHLVDFAKWLNEISGGDDYKKGYIDINPAKIEYLLNGTFGGMFTFPNKLNKTGETIFGDREFEWRNIPIANRLIKSGDERTANRKLQNEYFKYLKEYESTRKLMKKYENAADEGVIKYAEKVNFLENSPEYLRHEIFDSFKPDIDADREAIADAERSERATAENQMYADMRQLVNALHDPTAYFKNLYDAGLLDDEYIEWLKSHHGIKLK